MFRCSSSCFGNAVMQFPAGDDQELRQENTQTLIRHIQTLIAPQQYDGRLKRALAPRYIHDPYAQRPQEDLVGLAPSAIQERRIDQATERAAEQLLRFADELAEQQRRQKTKQPKPRGTLNAELDEALLDGDDNRPGRSGSASSDNYTEDARRDIAAGNIIADLFAQAVACFEADSKAAGEMVATGGKSGKLSKFRHSSVDQALCEMLRNPIATTTDKLAAIRMHLSSSGCHMSKESSSDHPFMNYFLAFVKKEQPKVFDILMEYLLNVRLVPQAQRIFFCRDTAETTRTHQQVFEDGMSIPVDAARQSDSGLDAALGVAKNLLKSGTTANVENFKEPADGLTAYSVIPPKVAEEAANGYFVVAVPADYSPYLAIDVDATTDCRQPDAKADSRDEAAQEQAAPQTHETRLLLSTTTEPADQKIPPEYIVGYVDPHGNFTANDRMDMGMRFAEPLPNGIRPVGAAAALT